MRKTELKNCPQWLMDAATTNEDVDFNEYGVLIWRGGEFRGGEFRGGHFLGGKFRGEEISKAPIFIFNIGKWSASITKTKMSIGCQSHTHNKLVNFTDDEIRGMSNGAIEFWQKNKEFLLFICAKESKVTE